jgi:Ribbon-helix-helix protein, copG family
MAKVTVNLPEETIAAIKVIADDNGINMTEALRQLIGNQYYLHNRAKEGNKLLLETKDGNRQKELIFATNVTARK